MTDEKVRLLAIPMDELSAEEMKQLRQAAERQDWKAMRAQLVHYSKRFAEQMKKEKETKS